MADEKKDYKSGISSTGIMPLAAVMYAASANQKDAHAIRVGSTVLNRLKSGKPEFGADTGSITNVIQKGYYEYNSPLWQEAMSGKFKDKVSEDRFKKIMALGSGLMRGTVETQPGEFFFTDSEIPKIKKQGFNMNLVEEVGKSGDHRFFRYKTGDNSVLGTQKMLKDAGFDPGPLDGIMGKRTKAAMAAYRSQSK